MDTGTFRCTLCGHVIQKMTATANRGLCAQCVKLPASRIAVRRLINSGLDPFEQAIRLYCSLIPKIAVESADRHFGGIGDPVFESLRFYTLSQLTDGFNYDEAVEVGTENVDEIEGYLFESKGRRSVFIQILAALKMIAPGLNAKDRMVFIGSWSMGPAEIGWGVRYLNDRRLFERYLADARITEVEVEAYDAPYQEELKKL